MILFKRFTFLVFFAIIATLLISCDNQGSSGVPEEQSFKWWIGDTDGQGTYYLDYEDNPGIQWLNQQKWSSETGSYVQDGSGKQLDLSFMTPVKGSERDNFNTMIATGSYPDIINMAYSNDSPRQLYEDGILIEVTEYVEEYMPAYLEVLEENPELKRFVAHTDEEGNDHYYGLWHINNAPKDPWQGYVYRRDWIVNYAEPTSHVWDRESEYVTLHGHPKYTPLSEAKSQSDMTGWKANEVTSFTSNFGDQETWEDNIVFPSGTTDPLYISDWEWMFEAFKRAIQAEGFSDNPNAYATTLYYMGYMQTGDLVSSFGGGGPMWYIDDEGNPDFGATGENFRTYVEAMNVWYENGWLDQRFDTRGSDQFYEINLTGCSQGMVGLWQSGNAFLGTTIRATAENENAREQAMVFGASLPINDVYGEEDNKFKEPDTFYREGQLGGAVGFTEKIEGKDLETLFTMLNWFYTQEGGLTLTLGLNESQLESVDLSPDLYEEYDIESAYTVSEGTDDRMVYETAYPRDHPLFDAIKPLRLTCYYQYYTSEDIVVDAQLSSVIDHSINQWKKFENSGYILDYNGLFDSDQSSLYARIDAYINTCMSIAIPSMIKNGVDEDSWDTYEAKIDKYGPERITDAYDSLID